MTTQPNGPEIRRRRVLLGLSGSAFSARIKISRVTLSNIENGKDGASPEMLKKIADNLGCAVSDISKETIKLSVDVPKDFYEWVKKHGGEEVEDLDEKLLKRIISEWMESKKDR